MTISMYQASVPAFVRGLTNLRAILDKAEAYAEARKLDPQVLMNDRLFPDMLPFRAQIYIATDTAKGVGTRLAEVMAPVFEDTQETFPALKQRIDDTIAYLASLTPAQIDGTEEKEVVLERRAGNITFNGLTYLTGYALPNFYFHTATAYALLRHRGLEIGKLDYLGRP